MYELADRENIYASTNERLNDLTDVHNQLHKHISMISHSTVPAKEMGSCLSETPS